MLIHLGRGVSVHDRDVIALCDLRQSAGAPGLAEGYRRRGLLHSLGDDPKTLVLCRHGTRDVCYLSCVGLRTLRQRMAERRSIEMREVQHG